VRGQVGRAGHVEDAHLPQRACDQAAVIQGADPQHAVEAFAYNVHAAVGGAQFNLDARVQGEEGGQLRDDQVAGHAAGHVHPQAAAELAGLVAEQVLQFVHVVQQIVRALLQLRAVGGQVHPARGPVQQLGAHLGLQPGDGLRDAGLGQTQTVGGAGERAQFGDAQEDAQGVEAVHGLFVWLEQ